MNAPRRRFLGDLALALRYALRDLTGDSRGFAVFIACIVIGVAATSGVGGLSRSLAQGLAREGRAILGGDVAFTQVQRDFTPEEHAGLEKRGRIDIIALMRAMARRDDGETALVEIKAVDPLTYPASGALVIEPEQSRSDALSEKNGTFGLVADPLLIARLEMKIGDPLTIGEARFELRAALRSEPDKLAGGIAFGPRVLISLDALRASGLAQPGAIVRYTARLALPLDASDADVSRVADETMAAFPQTGWEVRKRDGVSPQFSRNLERFAQLLTLVALTALVAGGSGVANAVNGLVERKRRTFAILKALGAPASRVFTIALLQVLMVAAGAIFAGLVLGAALPFVAADALRRLTDLPVVATLDGAGLAMGALYGLLVTLVFAIGPLARAHDVSVAVLLRDEIDAPTPTPRRRYRVALTLAATGLVATVLFASADLKITGAYIIAVVAAVALLRGVAAFSVRVARAFPPSRSPRLRLALANIRRPRGLAAALIVSIGLTQTLLIALALVEGAIHLELARPNATKIPRFYFIDAPQQQVNDFQSFLLQEAPGAVVEHVPMMRGRIVAVKGARAETLKVADDVAWALQGDRGITFSVEPPANSQIVEGEWWKGAGSNPPLVSIEQRVAEGLDLKIGDEITVNVLGRDITARIANLRKVDWRSLGINFAMVFSPGAFAGAPYTELFTVAYSGADADARDARLARDVAKRFPMIAAIRVKDALEAADKIASQLTLAARSAAAIAIATATLALASAVAASQSARLHDAVVLKVLGATRPWLASAYAIEFAVLGAVASLFATLAGCAAAFAMVEWLMKIDFVFLPGTIGLTALVSLVLTIALGLAGTWRVLAEKPARALRSL